MVNNFNFNDFVNELDSLRVSESYQCDPDQCVTLLQKSLLKSTKILHMNIRSLNKNFDEFRTLLVSIKTNIDVIVLSECWIRKNPFIPTLSGYSSHFTNNNLTQNDGIVLYIKDGLHFSINEPQFKDANCLTCILGKDTVIVGIYRSPAYTNMDNFTNSLNNLLISFKHFKNIVLTGDININICNISEPGTNEYLNLLCSHGLFSAHSFPTRELNCLDHVMLKTNSPSITLVFNSFITDHCPVMTVLDHKVCTANIIKETKKVDYISVISKINNTDFSSVLNIFDANKAADFLVSTISNIIKEQTTISKISCKKRIIKPWITPGLLRCIKNRDKMHIKLKKNPNNEILKITYKRYRNFCNYLLRRLKRDFEREQFLKAKDNPKATWNLIKTITNTKRNKTSPIELLGIDSNPNTSLDIVNNFFADIGSSLASKIIDSNMNTAPTNTSPELPVSHGNSFVLLDTDNEEVERTILGLKSSCAVGWDDIPSNIIKACRATLVPYITHICNISFATGVFPKCFKKAIVHPIFKSGNRDNVNNYRPISVLSSMSKVLERLLNNRLVNYLESQNLISPNQFGFRKNKSTEDAVLGLTELVSCMLDSKKKAIGMFLDLSKAFDTVSVPILITKMERLGFRGESLNIFKDYLQDRSQCVKVDKYTSDDRNLSYGVPQGSILGPTLFIIYVNDLCQLNIPFCHIFTYADDTALVISGMDWSECKLRAESALTTAISWLNQNLLTMNVNKTMYMTFSMNTVTQPPELFSIQAHTYCLNVSGNCNCSYLNRVNTVKYLGVYIDNILNWNPHLESLVTRVRRLIYIFKSIRHTASLDTLKIAYSSLCESIINYCNVVWGGAHKTKFLLLERAQRAVIKVLLRKPFRCPTSEIYKSFMVLTARQLYINRVVMRTHSSISLSARKTERRRWMDRVCAPYSHRTKFLGRQYIVLSSRLYNKINHVHNISHLNKYNCKIKVRNWLLNLSYEETENLLKIVT